MQTVSIPMQQLPKNMSGSQLLKAQRHGFRFKRTEKRYIENIAKKAGIIEDIGEQPKPFKVMLSMICIVIAIVLAFIEGSNAQKSIAGIGGFSETAGFLIGFTLALLGLVTGELLSSGIKKDEFSGKYKPTGKWWLGLFLTIIYISGQYYLASRAGIGADGMEETVTTVKWMVLGIAILEVLFGMAFLKTALQMFTLFIANIRIKLSLKKMNREARRTEETWQRYIFEQNKTGQPLADETQAIKDARQFYNNGGFTAGESTTQNT